MALSQERKGTMAVSLTNFLDSGCIVASSVALTAWAAAFGFGAIMGDISANPAGFFPAAVIMCVVLLISLIVGVIWCPKTQDKTLDQITEERYGKLL